MKKRAGAERLTLSKNNIIVLTMVALLIVGYVVGFIGAKIG